MWQKLDLLCVQQPTRVSAGLASSDDCDYPTGQSGPSKSHQLPNWDGNEQSRLTSQRTVGGKRRKVSCEMVRGGLFLPEEKTAHHINSAHPGKHKANVKCRACRTFCTQTQNFPGEIGRCLLLETWNLKSRPRHQIGINPILRTSCFVVCKALVCGYFPFINKITSELILILY